MSDYCHEQEIKHCVVSMKDEANWVPEHLQNNFLIEIQNEENKRWAKSIVILIMKYNDI